MTVTLGGGVEAELSPPCRLVTWLSVGLALAEGRYAGHSGVRPE